MENIKHEHYDVIIAWAEGKPIQVKYVTDSNWKDFDSCVTPDFNSTDWDWRIKPKVKTIYYRNALIYTPYHGGHCVIAWKLRWKGDDYYGNILGFVKWLGDEQEVEVAYV